MRDGTAESIGRSKRTNAIARQKIARKVLADLEVSGDERAFHLWLTLSRPWEAGCFSSCAAEMGIVVILSTVFAVKPKRTPAAARLALTAPDHAILRYFTSIPQWVIIRHDLHRDAAI